MVKTSHREVLPASSHTFLYKAETVALLRVTDQKNKPFVIQSSRQLFCKVPHTFTFILTAPLSAALQLPPEGRVGAQGKYCHHFSHRVHLDSLVNVTRLERQSILVQRKSGCKKWFSGLPSAETLDISAKSNERSPAACECPPTCANTHIHTHR